MRKVISIPAHLRIFPPMPEQAIPTYEEILALPPETITQADYRTVSDVRCIYVETAEDEWGYTQRYWVSVDTGLLVVAERLYDGEPVYLHGGVDCRPVHSQHV